MWKMGLRDKIWLSMSSDLTLGTSDPTFFAIVPHSQRDKGNQGCIFSLP